MLFPQYVSLHTPSTTHPLCMRNIWHVLRHVNLVLSFCLLPSVVCFIMRSSSHVSGDFHVAKHDQIIGRYALRRGTYLHAALGKPRCLAYSPWGEETLVSWPDSGS